MIIDKSLFFTFFLKSNIHRSIVIQISQST